VHHSDDFQRACAILRRTGALDATLECARRYAERALADLEGAADNPYTNALRRLALASSQRIA
jgi:geranylgeranyl pyrophosphate synthase